MFNVDVVFPDSLKQDIKNVANCVSDKTLAMIGNFAVAQIKVRTQQGVDFNGKAFAPYSKRYKAKREAKGLPTGVVDLNWSGKMLAALTYTTINSKDNAEVIVKFSDATQATKAHGHNYNVPKGKPRRFMGLSENDAKSITEFISAGLSGIKGGD